MVPLPLTAQTLIMRLLFLHTLERLSAVFAINLDV